LPVSGTGILPVSSMGVSPMSLPAVASAKAGPTAVPAVEAGRHFG